MSLVLALDISHSKSHLKHVEDILYSVGNTIWKCSTAIDYSNNTSKNKASSFICICVDQQWPWISWYCNWCEQNLVANYDNWWAWSTTISCTKVCGEDSSSSSTARGTATETDSVIALCHSGACNNCSIHQHEWWWRTTAEVRVRSIDELVTLGTSNCSNIIHLSRVCDSVSTSSCNMQVAENPNSMSLPCEISKSSNRVWVLDTDAVTPS